MDHRGKLVVSSEEGFLVFLEVTLVTGRQAFQRCEKAEKRAGDAPSLAAQKLPGIGIFLLRHQAAAGGIFVREDGVGEFLGGE